MAIVSFVALCSVGAVSAAMSSATRACSPNDADPLSCAMRASSMLQGANGSLKAAQIFEEDDIDADMKPIDNKGIIIPLQRVAARGVDGLSFYVGDAVVGYPPQRLKVHFDTASGNIIVPHKKCKSLACKEHKRYSRQSSSTSEDIFRNGTRIRKNTRLISGQHWRETASIEYTTSDIGQGFVTGVEVSDRFCLADSQRQRVCTKPGMVMALTMDDTPFRAMPSDGIVGLSLGALSVSSTFNFLEMLSKSRRLLKQQFAITFGKESGELHIGGYDTTSLAAPVQWFPVHSPEEGNWQVPIKAVRVGGVIVDACLKGCHAIVDTGSSRLGVQQSHLPRLQNALTAARKPDGNDCSGPELSFDLGGMQVVLGADDYTDGDCQPNLGSLDVHEPDFYGVYTFGEQVLQHYFVAFDWESKVMGFAPTNGIALERSRFPEPRTEQAFI